MILMKEGNRYRPLKSNETQTVTLYITTKKTVNQCLMSCDLPDEALFILDVLYKGRHFRTDAGYHSEKLYKIYIKKFTGRSCLPIEDTLQILMNDGYVAQIRKKKVKYYIADMKSAIFALKNHGYNVVDGRYRKL